MNFLRKYDLTADFKMNIEANHATLAGHTFEHELRTAIVNGSFGSIDANEGDYLLGWDTDQFPANVYSATYCIMEVPPSVQHLRGYPAGLYLRYGHLRSGPPQGAGAKSGWPSGPVRQGALQQL